MATQGLDPSDVVEVDINLSAIGASYRAFGTAIVVGDSNVINASERFRTYDNIVELGGDFPLGSPEFGAGLSFFSQEPRPSYMQVGRWLSGPTSGEMRGAVVGVTQQSIGPWNAIKNGTLEISIDGAAQAVGPMDFTNAANLNGVAAIVGTAIVGGACRWDATNGQFVVDSDSTGVNSAVGYATATGAGTDVSAMLGLTKAAGASAPVAGTAGETFTAAVQALAASKSSFYGLTFATTAAVQPADVVSAATYIEALSGSALFGITISDPAALDPTQTTDLASQLQSAGFGRTFSVFSSSSKNAAASWFGRAFTVDFTQPNSTITMKFKDLPGITPEVLTETQAKTLKAKNVNVYAQYTDGTAITQEGVMASGEFFDNRTNVDWLKDRLQTGQINRLKTMPKIPQDDGGMSILLNQALSDMELAVTNGMLARGLAWNGPSVGRYTTGSVLPAGYAGIVQPLASQSPTDRAARKGSPMTIIGNIAGAVHSASLVVNLNR